MKAMPIMKWIAVMSGDDSETINDVEDEEQNTDNLQYRPFAT